MWFLQLYIFMERNDVVTLSSEDVSYVPWLWYRRFLKIGRDLRGPNPQEMIIESSDYRLSTFYIEIIMNISWEREDSRVPFDFN